MSGTVTSNGIMLIKREKELKDIGIEVIIIE